MLDADKIMKRFEALESQRGQWDQPWQMCAEYLMPGLGGHKRKSGQVFDSTAPLALRRFAAAMESFLIPRTQKWHSLVTGIPEVDEDPESAAWLERLRDLMFKTRYAPKANFADQMLEAFISLGVFGTAVVFVDDDLGYGLRYQCIPLSEVYLANDGHGRVDTVFRWYKLSARQALQEFGLDLPDDIKRDAEDPRRMENQHEFIHGVFPRHEIDKSRQDARNLPVASIHIAKAARRLVRESGYRIMPYAVSRFTVAPGEVYGRSPAMEVMPDIVQLNAMKKTVLRAAEKIVNPPLLTPEDDILNSFSLQPGSINYGGLDDQGRQRVVPLQLGANLPIGLELMEQSRQAINEAFYNNLFQVLVESPQKTATEVLEIAQEKAQLLAPAMGRQQSELLRAVIDRELDILSCGGALDTLPPAPYDLSDIQPRYETAMAQALNGREGQAILSAFAALSTLAQADPSVVNLVDCQAAGRAVWQSFGAPMKVTRNQKSMVLKELESGMEILGSVLDSTGLSDSQALQESAAFEGLGSEGGMEAILKAGAANVINGG